MKKNSYIIQVIFLISIGLSSCGLYNRNVMFQTKTGIIADSLLDAISRAEKNYIINKNDILDLRVFTNKGEQIIDPTGQLAPVNLQQNQNMQPVRYLVESSGYIKLPLLGRIKVEGYKLSELDSLLEKKYSSYYKDAFMVTTVINKRAIVLGASGGIAGISAQVVPLNNENMNLIEVLALAGGLDAQTKVNNIRVLRGDLKNPNVYLIDLSTIEGVRQANLIVQPNDIIYIERYNRIVLQTITSLAPVFTLITSLASLVTILYTISRLPR